MNSRRKQLRSLLTELPSARMHGNGNPEITAIEYDSRHVKPGSLFIAIRGLHTDGATFIHEAVSRGAAAVVGELPPPALLPIPFIEVSNARRALANLAWSFFDHPERDLTIVGITGTNGKTTVASILRDVLAHAGYRTGLAGTLGVYYGDIAVETARTTPESTDLAEHFAAMRDIGCSHLVMEATSIGIDLERTHGLPFRVAVFTNLTRDHLDYHGSEEAYCAAKLRLFSEQSGDTFAAVNTDDPRAASFIAAACGRVLTYSVDRPADFRAVNVELTRQSVHFDLQTTSSLRAITAPLIGQFNVYNLLAVIAAAHALGIPLEIVQSSLEQARPARGRAEIVSSSAPFTVIVDYAHTPDALEKILTTLRHLKPQRILTIIGAGGDRDRGKRPIMAEYAFRLSDCLFLTSDNPRSEDPNAILDEMATGLPPNGSYQRDADRHAAIFSALNEARSGDIVLIAGKGHETHQEIKGTRHPFDDRQVAWEWLKRAGYAQ